MACRCMVEVLKMMLGFILSAWLTIFGNCSESSKT
jgi:hypothetical protein